MKCQIFLVRNWKIIDLSDLLIGFDETEGERAKGNQLEQYGNIFGSLS